MIKPKKQKRSLINSNILIQNFHPSYRPPLNFSEIRNLVTKVFKGENHKIQRIEVNLLTDSVMMKINKKFLKHNYNTDIIAFQYNNGSRHIDGELLLSLDTIRKNAKIYGSGYKNEFMRVLIHGCLHLSGYDDSTKSDLELIRNRENSYIGIK